MKTQDTRSAIADVCDEVKALLLEKNRSYGDSALNPVRIFSKAPPLEQIDVRIDDKLSRIARGSEVAGDDTELDLIGYLVLRRVARRVGRTSADQANVRHTSADQADGGSTSADQAHIERTRPEKSHHGRTPADHADGRSTTANRTPTMPNNSHMGADRPYTERTSPEESHRSANRPKVGRTSPHRDEIFADHADVRRTEADEANIARTTANQSHTGRMSAENPEIGRTSADNGDRSA